MNCTNCHREIPDDAVICPYCGDKSGTMTVRQLATMKSYTGAAILIFFLYWLFFLPGFIFNIIYYREATRMQKIAGHGLPGTGCLAVMLWVNVIGLILVVVGACLFVALGGSLSFLGLLLGSE